MISPRRGLTHSPVATHCTGGSVRAGRSSSAARSPIKQPYSTEDQEWGLYFKYDANLSTSAKSMKRAYEGDWGNIFQYLYKKREISRHLVLKIQRQRYCLALNELIMGHCVAQRVSLSFTRKCGPKLTGFLTRFKPVPSCWYLTHMPNIPNGGGTIRISPHLPFPLAGLFLQSLPCLFTAA